MLRRRFTTNLSFSAPVAILGRYLDRAEPVNGDAEDGVDGAQADGVVDRQPQIAQHLAEVPVLPGQQVDRVERHRYRPCQDRRKRRNN